MHACDPSTPHPHPTSSSQPHPARLHPQNRSIWHGPDRDGRLQLEWMGPEPPSLPRQMRVSALLGPDVASDVQMLNLIAGLGAAGAGGGAVGGSMRAWPLLPAMVRPPPAPAGGPKQGASPEEGTEGGGAVQEGSPARPQLDAGAAAAVAGIAARFRLNDAQEVVAKHVASWLPALRRGAVARGGAGGIAAMRRPALGGAAAGGGLKGSSGDAAAGGGGEDQGKQEQPAARQPQPALPVCLIHGGS
jgi:hypothetical protein